MNRIFTTLLLVVLSYVSVNAQLGRAVQFDSIQYVSAQKLAQGDDDPEYFGEDNSSTIVVEGVVCQLHPGFYGLSATSRKSTILFSKDHTGKWSGLEVMADPSVVGSADLATLLKSTKFYENFIPGLTVKCKGQLGSYQDNTQLYLLEEETEVTNLTKMEIKPTVVSIDSFKNSAAEDQPVTGEPYEHVYIELQNVTVVNRSEWTTGRWNWSVKDANGLVLDIRDFSGHFRGDANTDSTIKDQASWQPPAEGSKLEYIRGVIVQDNRTGYQLAPLMPTDIGLGDVVPPTVTSITTTPNVPTSDDDITVGATITDDVTVASVKVNYAVGIDNDKFTTLDAANVNGDDWEATIPKQADGSLIKIYLEAIDNDGNSTFSPDETGMSIIVKVINGGLRRISDIQETPLANGESLYKDKRLTELVITGVAMATDNYLGLTSIQDGTDPHSGILIQTQAGDGLSQLKRGDLLTITEATVVESFGVTYLSNITYTRQDGNTLYDPIKNASIDSFQSNTEYAESYEGMLLEWENMVVANNVPDSPNFYGEFTFAKEIGQETPQLRVDDISPWIEQNFANDSLENGQELDYIRGVMFYSFGNYKLLPRDKNDIDGYFTRYPKSIDEINRYINLQVFPNPANDQLNISFELKPGDDNVRIEILDLTGKTVIRENVSGSRVALDVANLESGAYVLRVNSDQISTSYIFTKG